jgi:ABC-type sugar transport system substrate-binding protein/methyl-accepting chemotaxis protein
MKISIRTKFLFAGLLPLVLTMSGLLLIHYLMTTPNLVLSAQILVVLGGIGLNVTLAVRVFHAMTNSFKHRIQEMEAQSPKDARARVLQEMNALIQAVQAGNLSARGHSEVVEDTWRELVVGFNQMLALLNTLFTTIAEFIDRISKGEIPGQLSGTYYGEFNKIISNLNLLHEKLSDFTAKVQVAADQIAVDSKELHGISEHLSVDAATQATSTKEISVSMAEIVATIRQNAEHALQTEKFALKAVEDAREAGESVTQAVQAMHNIAQKSSIIKTIAAQTRMLSLNATIEAARAQDYGRAFAVVASEVRKLADITQKAAEEIDELTSSSMAISEQAGQQLDKLVPAIQKTAEWVQEISAANNEQSRQTEPIHSAIQQLAHITHQNAEKAEELASTAAVLAKQAAQLQKVNVFFKMTDAALESVYAYAAEHHGQEMIRCETCNPETFARKRYRIGFVVEGLSNSFLIALKDDAEAVVKAYPNVTLEVLDGQDDITRQIAAIEQLLAQKVDALMIESANPQMLLEVLERADAIRIPYFCCLKGTKGVNAVSQVVAGYSVEGKIMGEFIAEQFRHGGNVVIIEGIPGDESSILRCHHVRKAIADNPKLKLLASRPGYFRQGPAKKIMEAFLAEFPQIDLVYCANDENALGALAAIREAGKLGDIHVVGIDAEQAALQAIMAGEMLATATHARGGARWKTLAGVTMQLLIDYLMGKDVPRWLVSETQLVTKANAAQITPLF